MVSLLDPHHIIFVLLQVQNYISIYLAVEFSVTDCVRTYELKRWNAGGKQNSRRKRLSFDKYDQPLENIREKTKRSQRRSTNAAEKNDAEDVDKIVTNNDAATNSYQCLIWKATQKALIGIGNVFQHDKQDKSNWDIELGIDSSKED